jgi:DNA-binding Lrp family transcriptional regulator
VKDIKLRLIAELMKNSRRSDRELAKALRVSQPTVTRTRDRLEKEGYLREYTVIPDFVKLGFQLASFILVKVKQGFSKAELEKAQQIRLRNMASEGAPNEIVLFNRGIGGGYSAVLVSFHKSYPDYTQLVRKIKESAFVDTSNMLSFIVDLNDKIQYRHFTFSTLAQYLLTRLK